MRMMLCVMVVSICLSTPALADSVVLKNGDKLSVTFVSARDKKLSLHSEILGDLLIPLDKVESFTATKPAVVVRLGQQPLRGQIELQPSGDWNVTENGQSQIVAASATTTVLPAETYHKVFEEPANITQDWKGSINFGYALQSGNQKTRTLTGVIAAVRERPQDLLTAAHWRTNFALNMLYSKAKEDGIQVKSNSISSALREDYLFTSRDFVFIFAQLDHIGPQGLYLRQTYGGGIGRDLIHNQRMLFSGILGANYVREHFISGPSNRSSEGLLGEKFGVQINSRLRFDHDLNFYPDLQRAARYHGDASAIFGLKINHSLSANLGAIDQYISRPAPGSKNNNIAFTTGLGYIF